MADDPVLFGDTVAQQFFKFHHEHPNVYKQLVNLAYQWKDAGHQQLGIATLFEKLRWEWHVGTIRDSSGFKLNNNYRAFYARLIMDENPELRGMFNLRAQKDEW